MLKGIRLTSWQQQQLLIAVVFCAAYILLRSVAISYWIPHYGLWFGGVLLLPRRFWPALVAGNIAATVPVAYACFDQYGWVGSLLHLFPVSAFAMLLVQPLRAQLPSTVSGKRILEPVTARHIVALLGCMLVFALISAADMALQLIQTRQPQDDPGEIGLWSARFLLGAYLGCLILVPLALAIHEAIRRAESWPDLVRQMGRSRLLFEGVVLGLACVGLLTAMGAGMAGEMWRQVARMAMFLPVAWMAVRYGWQGAAVGGTAASIGIMLAMPTQYDPATIAAQTVMAFCLTLLLPLGAKINTLNEQDRERSIDHRQIQQAARRDIYQSERRLRRSMEMQAQAHEYIQEGYSRLLKRMSDVLPEQELQSFNTLQVLTQRYVDSVKESFMPSPWEWQQQWLKGALLGGPIAEMAEECGLDFDAHISDRVSLLSSDAQWTVYRLICEAVVHVLMQSPATPCIHLHVRVMMVGPKRDIPWAVLVVTGEPEPPMAQPVLLALPNNCHLLLSRLGAVGLGLAGMRDRASLYQGRLRYNAHRRRLSVSLLLGTPDRDTPDVKRRVKSDVKHAHKKARRLLDTA